jgi:hypothetical protein
LRQVPILVNPRRELLRHSLNLINGNFVLVPERLIQRLFSAHVLFAHQQICLLKVPTSFGIVQQLIYLNALQQLIVLNAFIQLRRKLLVRLQLTLYLLGIHLVDVNTHLHQVQFQLQAQNFVTLKVVLLLTVYLQTRQHVHRFAYYVLQKTRLDFGYLESSRDKNCQILQVCYARLVLADPAAYLFIPQVFQVLEYHFPTQLVNVEKILFVVGNKNRGVTFAQFLNQNLVVRKQFLKLRLVFLHKFDTFRETSRRRKDMILDPKNAGIRQRRTLNQILMNVLRVNQPLKIKL